MHNPETCKAELRDILRQLKEIESQTQKAWEAVAAALGRMGERPNSEPITDALRIAGYLLKDVHITAGKAISEAQSALIKHDDQS
jgi:hypothetical protein